MSKKGKIIKDEYSSMQYIESSGDTGGKYVKFLVEFYPGSFKAAEHIHMFQDENFKVVKGTLTYKLNGSLNKIRPGKEIFLPKGIPHTHYNDENETLTVEQTISPALDVEYLVETIFGFACEGRVKNGKIPFLQVMLWLNELQSKTYLATIPVSVQNLLSKLLSPVAKMSGYQVAYKRFSGTDIK